ncbi:MAG: TIGR03118 family protein [Gemmataceae bacterium]
MHRRSPSFRRPLHRPRLERLEDRCTPAVTLGPVAVAATEGQLFSGTVLTFSANDPTPQSASNYQVVSIDWGDGSSSPANGSAVSVVTDPSNPSLFDVRGSHTYTEEGHFVVNVTVHDSVDNTTATTAFVSETNLVTDDQAVLASLGFAPAAHVDANLKNPWGMSFGPTSPLWVSDNGTGVSTLYNAAGVAQALVVTIPASANAGATSPAPVTGQVFNGSASDFLVAGAGTAAHFIFATEDGTIAAWNSGTSAVLKVDNADFVNGPVYKGLAIGNTGTANVLYATNFRAGTIDVFDTNFNKVSLAGDFTDPTIPAGFAPFNIAKIGGQLYVTYAMQNGAKHDDVAGAGNGFVNVFDLNGHVVKRLASNGALNSPWGLALAPATFGQFGGDLLVGNFGDGHISVFNPTTGAFLGQLTDATDTPVAIDGLWGLTFGNNGVAGPAGTLIFTAGINGEADGLLGNLTVNTDNVIAVADAGLLPGAVASVTATATSGVGDTNVSGGAVTALNAFEAAIGGVNNGANPPAQAAGFRAINWDGVELDGTDFGGNTTVIDPGHVVGIPINRFQERGVQFDSVYAVSGPASPTDASTFSTVNPSVSNLFPAFSPANTFAMFNDHTLDIDFVLASSHTSAPVLAATRGFGAIFRNVELANSTSIEYFNGDTSLGKFFVPVGAAGQAEFLGELFANPVVTRVSITLGTDVLFSFDGVHFSAGPQADDPAHGHNLVVTDDFVYAEPQPLSAGQPTLKVNEGATFNGTVATFTDLNPNATTTDFTATINWGNGVTAPGVVTAVGGGVFNVSGSNSFTTPGTLPVSVLIQDVGGSSLTINNRIQVRPVEFAVGKGNGTPEVKVYDALTGAIKFDFMPYAASFRGGVRVAIGDVTGDGIPDIVTAAGPGGGPHVEVFDGVTGNLLDSFFAYTPTFSGGVTVAVGDVNGDGRLDVVTGADAGGGPHVKVIDATKLAQVQANGQIADGALLDSFFAYAATFTGGVRVATGDVNGDGKADIITGAGPGGGPHVRVFDATNLAQLLSFFAFDTSYSGGVFVAGGDLDGDGKADLAVSQGVGTQAHLRTFSGLNAAQLGDIVPFANAANGARVAMADRDADGLADVIVGTASGGVATVKTFKGTTLALESSFTPFDPTFLGGVFVG